LRGDATNEEKNGGSFRDRLNVLGDIIHSSPLFKNDVLWTGANDGMLHAFGATDGTELFAYVPRLVFENLRELSLPSYTHKYFVDLTPTAADVTLPGVSTMLVGGLRKGGKGYYALDISDPLPTTEGALAGRVMWEYPRPSTPAAESDDLGFSYSSPTIVKSNDTDAKWIVIFGNGYNSENSNTVLFILNASDGTLLKKIDTGVGSCSGLSSITPIDVDSDDKVDYVFAGDLEGNMWKFDLTDSDFNNWDVAYFDGTTPKPLFQAKDAAGLPQPITSKPDVRRHCLRHGFLVVFATGKYLGESDITDTSVQTIYGVWDYGDDDVDSEFLGSFDRASPTKLSNQPSTVSLLEQTEIDFRTVNNLDLRTLSDNAIVWLTEDDSDPGTNPNPSSLEANHAGWYFDLPISGERVVSDVSLRGGNAIVISFTPEDAPCGTGGDSLVHEMNSCSGGRLQVAQFDIDLNRYINLSDLLNIGTALTPNWVAPTAFRKVGAGRLSPPAILRMGETEIKYFSTAGGSIVTLREKAVPQGMSYWMEFE
jgi:type IV pilus assembly protein PilY1